MVSDINSESEQIRRSNLVAEEEEEEKNTNYEVPHHSVLLSVESKHHPRRAVLMYLQSMVFL
jgi:hypothetical protein